MADQQERWVHPVTGLTTPTSGARATWAIRLVALAAFGGLVYGLVVLVTHLQVTGG